MRRTIQAISAIYRAWTGENQSSRDWTKEETMAVFHHLRSSNGLPEDFNRSEKECTDHYADVIGFLFEHSGSSRTEGIEATIKEFYSKARSPQVPFTEEQTITMVTQYLIDRQPIARGSGQDIEACEAHFRTLMAWVFERRGFPSSDEAIDAAINAFYERECKKAV